MRQLSVVTIWLVLCSATWGVAADHPVFDRQKARDQRLSKYTLELEQYGVIRKDFAMERMKERFRDEKYGDPVDEARYADPLPPCDEDGYTDASFRFALVIDVFDKLTHGHRRTLPQDHMPFAFPRLPSEIRFTNASGFSEALTDPASSIYTVAQDHGTLQYRRTIWEWCCGFGLTRYLVESTPVTEKDLGNGLTECVGVLNLPFMGPGKFHAEIDSQDIVRSLVFIKETYSKDTVIHTVTTTGQYRVGADVVADKGDFAREIPFQSVDGQEFRRTEIDDGFTTQLTSMTVGLTVEEFGGRSRIKEVPANALFSDLTNGKAKLPPRAGVKPPQSSGSRFWLFTLNLAALVGFSLYLWRKRSRPSPAPSPEH